MENDNASEMSELEKQKKDEVVIVEKVLESVEGKIKKRKRLFKSETTQKLKKNVIGFLLFLII